MSLPLEIESRLKEIEAQIEQGGAELVEAQYRRTGHRGVLTFLVDKKGGISLEECAELNRRLGHFFDQMTEQAAEGAGFLTGSYFLEVCSPGLDRPLKAVKDFRRVVGEQLRVQTRDERGTVTTSLLRLNGVDDAGVELQSADGAIRRLAYGEIFKATRDTGLRK